jgi:hypothetical protein
MRLVRSTTTKNSTLLLLAVLAGGLASAQDNSPYSRYGLGDIQNGANVANRGLGGLSAAYSGSQFVNFLNPASYAGLRVTTFDLGLDYSSHTLRTNDAASRKFTSNNLILSYLQLGFPIGKPGKANRGLNIGLRPVSLINYKIEKGSRLAGVDSITTLYEGSGGGYQAYAGTGWAFKDLRVGFNVGYFFGKKEYSTKVTLESDSVIYYKSDHNTTTSYGNFFLNLGIQYDITLNEDPKTREKTLLHLGAYGNMQQKLKARRDFLVRTFDYDQSGAALNIDSVYEEKEVKGTIVYPSSYGVGFAFERENKWLWGVDFTASNWSKYRYYGTSDSLRNSWMIKAGGQVIPNALANSKYWSLVTYRAGFYYGTDYVKVGNNQPVYGLTLGLGLPVRKRDYSSQYTVINTAFEFGRRGNTNNLIRENFVKVSVGLSLSDLWFRKSKFY